MMDPNEGRPTPGSPRPGSDQARSAVHNLMRVDSVRELAFSARHVIEDVNE